MASSGVAKRFIVVQVFFLLLGATLAQSSAKETVPENPSRADILQKWTPGGDTNAADLPYRHRFEKFELETDQDWADDRWQQTDWGPTFTHSTELPGYPLQAKNLTIFLNREKNIAAMFDLKRCGLIAIVSPASLKINPARFGLLHKPRLTGEQWLTASEGPLWETSADNGSSPKVELKTRYHGLRLNGWHVLLEYSVGDAHVAETTWVEATAADDDGGGSAAHLVVRQLKIEPTVDGLVHKLCAGDAELQVDGKTCILRDGEKATAIVIAGDSQSVFETRPDGVWLQLPPNVEPTTVTVVAWHGLSDDLSRLSTAAHAFAPADYVKAWRQPAGLRWGEPIASDASVGSREGQPYVCDEIWPPFDNPYDAPLFLSGLGFWEDGTAAVSTAHGDVWMVRGLTGDLENVTWQRFATGLYQPLGLEVVDGKVIVLGRDQITRLHDLNSDGEADWYECLNSDLTIWGQDHAYAMQLKTNPEGVYYFLKAGTPPHGSTLYKLSADGQDLQRVATGFRHPFGLGVGPNGEVTVADNEGNWVPSSKIDLITPGGFYGYLGKEKEPPPGVVPQRPLCFLPKVADNASGGQIWNTSDEWGDYHRNRMLHFSWGRATLHAVLEQQVGDVRQAATVAFPGVRFTSGPADAQFHPQDGQLYVVGLDGWQTAATHDGCLTRLRYVGGPVDMPTGFQVYSNGIRVEFSEPIDPTYAADLARYRASQWNYQWAEKYGSYHYSAALPDRVGHDGVAIDQVDLLPDGRSVFLHVSDLQRVDQFHLHVDLRTRGGRPLIHDLYSTINALPDKAYPAQQRALSFGTDNLLAWCIVPFDAERRDPHERAAMLNRLGIHRVAYDWRAEHVPTFAAELASYRRHNIELVGFWTPVATPDPLAEPQVQSVLSTLRSNNTHTQLWVTLPDSLVGAGDEQQRVSRVVQILQPLAEEARRIGCRVGLYNHGGWFGEVEHQIAIIKRLEKEALFNVGIVYNLHHGHGHLEKLASLLAEMRPYLYVLNLNGMRADGPKIVPVGQGDDDLHILRLIEASGYRGPIGILDHRPELDAEEALRQNLDGLQELAATRHSSHVD